MSPVYTCSLDFYTTQQAILEGYRVIQLAQEKNDTENLQIDEEDDNVSEPEQDLDEYDILSPLYSLPEWNNNNISEEKVEEEKIEDRYDDFFERKTYEIIDLEAPDVIDVDLGVTVLGKRPREVIDADAPDYCKPRKSKYGVYFF